MTQGLSGGKQAFCPRPSTSHVAHGGGLGRLLSQQGGGLLDDLQGVLRAEAALLQEVLVEGLQVGLAVVVPHGAFVQRLPAGGWHLWHRPLGGRRRGPRARHHDWLGVTDVTDVTGAARD